jgi:hypothetical protein
VTEVLDETTEPTAPEPEPEPAPTPEPEPEPAPEPESRCEAETTVGGTLYRCALEAGHDDDHRFQPVDDSAPAADSGEDAIGKAIPRLEAEALRHAKRVREIMGEDADGLTVCELCLPVIPGYRWDGAPDQATTERVRVAIGMPALDNYRPSATEAVCDDCAGLGRVKTGSHVPQHETATCDGCKGKGYRETRPRLNELPAAPAAEQGPNGATSHADDGIERDMFGTPATDPDFGKMPNMRQRPVDYWQSNRE